MSGKYFKARNLCEGSDIKKDNAENAGEWSIKDRSVINLRYEGLWWTYASGSYAMKSPKKNPIFLREYFEGYPEVCTQGELLLFTMETSLDLEAMWEASPFKKPYEVVEDK